MARKASTARRTQAISVKMTTAVHREMKIASAHRGQQIQEMIAIAWKLFKQQEGDRLYREIERTAA